MAMILSGRDTASSLNCEIANKVDELSNRGIVPTLGVIRVGENESDLSYERGLVKRFTAMEAGVKKFVLPADVSEEELERTVSGVNADAGIHGILLFRPLPGHLDEEKILKLISPEKDVDGVTDPSLAGVFLGKKEGFPPCTAEACIRILDHYHYAYEGKNAVVIGRSAVVGKPAAMMLLKKNATVTIVHTRTRNLSEIIRNADLVIAAAGHRGTVGEESFSSRQTIVDVGINVGPDGKLCGDVDFEKAKEIVEAITPVPGGVGAVTTAVLLNHVADAAIRQSHVRR